MSDAKIEVKIGAVAFSGEATEVWLADQLHKFLQMAPGLMRFSSSETTKTDDPAPGTRGASGGVSVAALAAFLKETNATVIQTRKFLATAGWLHKSEGKERISTADVTAALNSHSQGRLGNAAQCLIHCARSGFVAKDGAKQFYVTPEGWTELGK
jgi:hypothetical protein